MSIPEAPWKIDEMGWIMGADSISVVEYARCGSHEIKWGNLDVVSVVLAAPQMLKALRRLASSEAFDMPGTMTPEVLARIKYAEAAIKNL